MDLDKLQFRADVRNGWQALDLGYLIARRWWPALVLSSAIPAILLFIPLLLVFFESPYWAVFIIWWLKPFWERLPLFYASRRIFADEIATQQLFSQSLSLYLRDALPWILWRRLSLQRAFDAPVTLLEGLKGKPRRQRLRVLHGKYVDTAVANQLVGSMFELIVATGLFSIVMLLLPEEMDLEFFNRLGQLTLNGEWLYSLCMFVAMFMILPFHVMAGFALYLNRRIELEAWDIEITFRNLASRKKNLSSALMSIAPLLLCLSLSLSLIPQNSRASVQIDRDSAHDLIEQVLQDDDFGSEKTVRKWRFRNLVEENEDKIPDWFIDLIVWLEKWLISDGDTESGDGISAAAWVKLILIALFIGLLVYLLYRFRTPLSRIGRRSEEAQQRPDVLFGLDVTPESIPDDVPTQVRALWREQRHREALGLLYRATLANLIDRHGMAFKSSHTEAECAALVSAANSGSLSVFFSHLTEIWRRLAYGHQLPEQQVIDRLCHQWSEELDHGQA